jgi:S1-C subfamily serine protease
MPQTGSIVVAIVCLLCCHGGAHGKCRTGLQKRPGSIYVTAIAGSSPAQEAVLQVDAIITAVDGRELSAEQAPADILFDEALSALCQLQEQP